MRDEYVFEEKQVGKYTVKILQDDDPMNPRTEYDNVGHMICFHRRYNLGDKHNMDIDELKEICKRKDVYSLPLYLYDHSGITMNTSGFSCPWDSGQVGRIYMTREDYLKNWNKKRVNKKHIIEILKAEVEEYDNYLTGEVYGYRVEDEEGSVIASCRGYNGDIKYALEEGISEARALIRNDIKKHVEQVKTWIKNRVPLDKREPLTI